MSIGVIGDSSCDLTAEMRANLGADIAPLKIMVEDRTYVDDSSLNLPVMLKDMRDSKQGAVSACPAPDEFASLMRKYDECMVVTLSSKLSGSYNSALAAKDIVLEENPEKKIHVFDSQSASPGQVQAALMIGEMDKAGKPFEEIVQAVTDYLATMRTFFVLEDLGNFIKNGRLNRLAGTFATILSIRPIMADDGTGDIVALEKLRGTRNALSRMVELVAEQTCEKAKKSLRLILAECNCPGRAVAVREDILAHCPAVKEVFTVKMGGLSSMYANEGGIIVAF